MIIYYLVFLIGMPPGYVISDPRKARLAYWVMVGCGYALIALLGMQMAAAPEVRRSLPCDLLAAALIALFAAIGSVLVALLFIWGVQTIFARQEPAAASEAIQPAAPHLPRGHIWRPTGIAFGLLFLGMLCGTLLPAANLGMLIRICLLTMILAVGIQSGYELRIYMQQRPQDRPTTPSARILFLGLPIAVMAGTLVCSAGTGFFLPFRWSDCMLCAAPMGWQTLGGPMIQDLRGPRLGQVAFLTNMFRDVISLLLIPLISRKRFTLLSVTPGGVSTMDILLPSIMAASGRQSLVYAMWIGACCSFWAPVLIYLIARAGA